MEPDATPLGVTSDTDTIKCSSKFRLKKVLRQLTHRQGSGEKLTWTIDYFDRSEIGHYAVVNIYPV